MDINHYADTEYVLTFPSIDTVIKRILDCGNDCFIAKIDISRAFRHLPVDPRDISSLGLYWEGSYYLDFRVPFGYRTGSGNFQRTSDAVRYIMSEKYNHHVINYCDDFLLINNFEKCEESFKILSKLLRDLGFTLAEKKLRGSN